MRKEFFSAAYEITLLCELYVSILKIGFLVAKIFANEQIQDIKGVFFPMYFAGNYAFPLSRNENFRIIAL